MYKNIVLLSFLFILQGCAHKVYSEDDVTYNERERKYYDTKESVLLRGSIVEYYDSGEKELETLYRKGIKHGVSKRYYKDGVVAVEIPYENDIVQGYVNIYAENGTLIESIPYKTNFMNGIAKYYSLEGFLSKTISYVANERDGLLVQYYSNGKDICFSILYDEGTPLKAILFFEDERIIENEDLNEWIASEETSCLKPIDP